MKIILQAFSCLSFVIVSFTSGCTDSDKVLIEDKLKEYKIISSRSENSHKFDRVVKHYPWGMIAEKERLLFIADLQGNLLNQSGFKKIDSFNNFDIARVTGINSKYGLLNKKGILIADPIYSKIRKFKTDGLAIVETMTPDSTSVNNPNNISHKRSVGIIDTNGKYVVKPEYFNIEYIDDISLYKINHSHFSKNNPRNSLFSAGKGWVENASYQSIGKFMEGIAIVDKAGKKGVIDRNAEIVIPAIYESVHELKEGLIRVFNDRQTAFFDSKGNIVIPFKKLHANSFEHGVSIVDSQASNFTNRKIGLMNKSGKLITGYDFSKIDPFVYYKELDQVLAKAKPINSRFMGIINTAGEYIIKPKYSNLKYDKKGYFAATLYVFGKNSKSKTEKLNYLVDLKGNTFIDTDNSNPNIKKPDPIGKIGILNHERNIISEPYYDDARTLFSNAIAVKESGKWGVINNKNVVIIESKYQDIKLPTPSIALLKSKGLWGILDLKTKKLTLPIEYQEIKVESINQVKAKQGGKWHNLKI